MKLIKLRGFCKKIPMPQSGLCIDVMGCAAIVVIKGCGVFKQGAQQGGSKPSISKICAIVFLFFAYVGGAGR